MGTKKFDFFFSRKFEIEFDLYFDLCWRAEIIQVGLNMHLHDDIVDASSSFEGRHLVIFKKNIFNIFYIEITVKGYYLKIVNFKTNCVMLVRVHAVRILTIPTYAFLLEAGFGH